MKKKLLSIALCLCMVLTLLPTAALAVDPPAPTEVSSITGLNTAITNATDDMEFKLSDSFSSDTGMVTIPEGKPHNFTIDLNGMTIDGGGNPTIRHYGTGTLTITDSGDDAGKVTSSNNNAICNFLTGTVNVCGGTVSTVCTGTEGSYAIWNKATGAVNVSGGTVSASGENAIAIFNSLTGKITISGNATVTSANENSNLGTILLSGDTAGVEVLKIEGGTVENTADNGSAIYNNGVGKITISGDAKVTSVNTFPSSGTIYLKDDTANTEVLKVEGGTVENTANGNAIYNSSAGTVTVSGGTVENTAVYGSAIYNNAAGAVIVSGTARVSSSGDNAIRNNATGAVTVSGSAQVSASNTSGIAIRNQATGKITISENAKVTSANQIDTYGTIYLNAGTADAVVLEITGATVENTASTGNIRRIAIYNNGAGTVNVSGGTVRSSNSFVAIYNNAAGTVNVSGGSINSINKMDGTLTNGVTPPTDVSLYTLTLSGITSKTTVSSISFTPEYAYGMNGVSTDESGKLYVWLPATQAAAQVTATVGGATYTGTISGNAATLSTSGGGNYIPTYAIINNTAADANGSLSRSRTYAYAGDTVKLTPKADEGFELATLTVKGSNGNEINLTKNADGTFSFKMPAGKVTVEATFKAIETPWVNPFIDVAEADWFYDSVKFANQKGLFEGTSADTFSPDSSMTRAMLWTVLGRLDGQTLTGSGVFDAAKAWAAEKGITDGTNPGGDITREQLITILWRYAGSPMLMDYPGLSSFDDAGDIAPYARQAMAWANQQGLIEGTGGKLMPAGNATRAQVAAILMRYCELVK